RARPPSPASRSPGWRAARAARRCRSRRRRARAPAGARSRARRAPAPPRRGRARRCGGRSLRPAPFELAEVDLGERLVDQPLLVGARERLARDLLGGEQAEPADLVADLAERLVRRLLDLAARLLEAALAVLLGLQADALALRVGDAAGLGEDLLALALRLRDQLPVLLEQVVRLGAGVVGLLDRLLDPLTALVDHALDRAERVALQHEERDRKLMIVQIISPGVTLIS